MITRSESGRKLVGKLNENIQQFECTLRNQTK